MRISKQIVNAVPGFWIILSLPFGMRSADAFENAAPCLVTVEMNVTDPAYQKYVHNIVADFSCSDLLDGSIARSLSAEPYYKMVHPEGFTSATGVATAIDVDGSMLRVRYWTVAGPEAFNGFVASILKRRSTEAVVTGSEFDKTIQDPGTRRSPDGRVEARYQDLRVKYGSGIIVLGSPSVVEAFSIRSLRKVVDLAEGRHWMVWVNPSGVPEKSREQFVQEVQKAASDGRQQRDAESPADYIARRAGVDAQLRLLQSAAFDVEEAYCWMQWPYRPEEFFQVRAVLRAKEKSVLAKMISSLRSGKSMMKLRKPEGAVANLQMNVAIPQDLAGLCFAVADMWSGSGVVHRGFARQLAGGGAVRTVSQLSWNDQHQLRLLGVLDIEASADGFEEVVRLVEGRPNSFGATVFSSSADSMLSRMGFRSVAVSIRDEILSYAASDKESEFDGANLAVETSDEIESSRVLARLEVDLSGIPEQLSDQRAVEILKNAEAAFEHWKIARLGGAAFAMKFAGTTPPFSEVRSFVNLIQPEGEWAGEATVTSGNSSIVVDIRAGRDLHRMLVARNLVAAAQFQKLLIGRRVKNSE